MRRFQFTSVVVLVIAFAAAGCSRLSPGPSPISGPEPTTAATEEECRAAAIELEQAFRSGDRERALQAFTLEVVSYRVVAGLPVADDLKPDLVAFLHSRADTNEFVDHIMTEVSKGGQFKLLGVRPADGRHKATCRLIRADFWVIYFDIIVARFPSGRVGVEEGIRLNDGERMTELLRYDVLPAAALRDPGLTDRLSAEDRLFLANSEKVKDMYRASRTGKWREVITVYNALPAGLRDRKPSLFRYAQACTQSRHAEQASALATCRRRFQGDPALDLLALDYHFYRHDFDAARQDLAALRKSVGEDPVLDAAEALVLFKDGQSKKARAVAEQAVEADPELKVSYLIRLAMALEQQDHADTLAWMKRLVEKTGHDFGNVRRIKTFAAFVNSPEFRQWLAWQATRRS